MQLVRDGYARSRIPPALLALAAQVIAAGLLALTPLHAGTLAWALAQGGAAALLGYGLRLAPWWWPMQFLFMPAVWLVASLQLSPHWFLGGFIMLALVYWGAYRSQVPLYLSSSLAWQQVARLLPQGRAFAFADLGCGVGSMVAGLAGMRGDGRFVGIESAPLPFLVSRLRAALGRGNCEVRWGDLWRHDLSAYDVVYAYLSPVPMARLWDKAQHEMAAGSLFISNSFPVPGVQPDCSIPLGDGASSVLHVWRMGGRQS
ncbi:MAG: class I SAM-dependent methyltransferase [Pseudomonadota bacterium]